MLGLHLWAHWFNADSVVRKRPKACFHSWVGITHFFEIFLKAPSVATLLVFQSTPLCQLVGRHAIRRLPMGGLLFLRAW